MGNDLGMSKLFVGQPHQPTLNRLPSAKCFAGNGGKTRLSVRIVERRKIRFGGSIEGMKVSRSVVVPRYKGLARPQWKPSLHAYAYSHSKPWPADERH